MIHKYCCYNSIVYTYVSEYVDFIVNQTNLERLVVDKMSHIYSEQNIYIFIQTIPDLSISYKNIILINIEQLTRTNFYDYVKTCLDRNIKVFDYSIENIDFIDKYDSISWLPYQINTDENNKLCEYNQTKKLYDIGFIGAISNKRNYILSELINKGYSVLKILAFGDVRDKMMASAKILLNIHFADDYNIHESLRCDRHLFSNTIVVSESSHKDNILDTYGLVFFSQYSNIVDTVIKILNNYDYYINQHEQKNKIMLDTINNNRKLKLDYFNKYIEGLSAKILKKIDRTNILEIYLSSWQNGSIKPGYVKTFKNSVMLYRGFNIFGIRGRKIHFINIFDTYSSDLSIQMKNCLYKLFIKKKYNHLLIVTHDDVTNKIDINVLQSLLFFLGCSKLNTLMFRGRYLFLYDINGKSIVSEIVNNQYILHEFYKYKKPENSANMFISLDLPIYIFIKSTYNFVNVANTIDCISKYNKNIHIISDISKIHFADIFNQYCKYPTKYIDPNVSICDIFYTLPQIFLLCDSNIDCMTINTNMSNFQNLTKQITNNDLMISNSIYYVDQNKIIK